MEATEKQVAHTPGPWGVSPNEAGAWKIMAPESVELIGTALNDANARLIAAAPELLAELRSSVKMMVNALDNMAYLFPAKTPEAQAWRAMLKTKVREARAAIAKATK